MMHSQRVGEKKTLTLNYMHAVRVTECRPLCSEQKGMSGKWMRIYLSIQRETTFIVLHQYLGSLEKFSVKTDEISMNRKISK